MAPKSAPVPIRRPTCSPASARSFSPTCASCTSSTARAAACFKKTRGWPLHPAAGRAQLPLGIPELPARHVVALLRLHGVLTATLGVPLDLRLPAGERIALPERVPVARAAFLFRDHGGASGNEQREKQGNSHDSSSVDRS